MTRARATDLVTVTVTSGTRCMDVLLPGAVPLVELVPELARSLGLLDQATAHGGYRVVTSGGRELASDVGLVSQGVEDGGLLAVGVRVDRPPVRRYDDVAEAMADAVEHDLGRWHPVAGHRSALVSAALLLTLGLVALCVPRPGTPGIIQGIIPGVVAGVIATALVLCGILLSRARDQPGRGVALAWMGIGYAAGAGLGLVPHSPVLGLPLAAAGAGGAIAGTVATAGLGAPRALTAPAIAVGVVALVLGVLVHVTPLSAPVVLMTVMAVAVTAGSVLPTIALGLTATRVAPLYGVEDIAGEAHAVDRRAVGSDARAAHEILLAMSVTVGLLLVLIAPVAAGRGVLGALAALDAAAVTLLRTRRLRVGAEVLVGLLSGVGALVAIAVSLLVVEPFWRPAVAAVLIAAGTVALFVAFVPAEHPVRRGRVGDVLETTALLLLLPLTVLGSGLLGGGLLGSGLLGSGLLGGLSR